MSTNQKCMRKLPETTSFPGRELLPRMALGTRLCPKKLVCACAKQRTEDCMKIGISRRLTRSVNHILHVSLRFCFLLQSLAQSQTPKMTFKVKCCRVKDEDGEELVCYGYKHNYFKTAFFYLLSLCSGGFLLLVAYWRPDWALQMKCSACPLYKAKYILLKTVFGTWFVEEVETRQGHYTRYGTSIQYGPGKTYQAPDHQDTYTAEWDSELESAQEKTSLMGPASDFSEVPDHIRLFTHQHLQYVWKADIQTFELLRALDENTTPSALYSMCRGLMTDEASKRYELYGPNIIDVNVKSYGRLFFEEAADPFYVFQVFSVVLWFVEDYAYYATTIFFISLGSILISIYQTRKHLVTLRDMVAFYEKVTVLRNNEVHEDTPSEMLVPGDVLVVPAGGMMMPCDAALISGNCIVNESMLTGESVPVTKTPLPRDSKDSAASDEKERYYKPEVHKRHTLFNGTRIIQTRYYGHAQVLAVVVRTGFSTTKGSLIRSILSPRPVGFKFFRDSMRFIGLLGILAVAGFAYSVYALSRFKMSAGHTVLNALDVITIAVPPALPAAMSVGIVYAIQRLKKHSIYCINPSRINMCGKLKLFCFDKTGTLTEDGLDILGVVPVEDARFKGIVQGVKYLPRGPLLAAMATCHSLTVIDGQLSGDPLDLKMFEATDWVLEEPGEDAAKFDSIVPTTVKPKNSGVFDMDSAMKGQTPPYEIAIVRQFPFSSDIQRMSVITRTLGAHHMDGYVKGAPETVVSLCDADTVPENFQEELQEYTRRGYRVLGLAWGPQSKLSWHQAQRINRDRVEKNLTFLGLLVLQNALKVETAPVINTLHDAAIRTVMVTGDNMLTAISVARECGMVKPEQKVVLVSVKPGEELSSELQLSWNVVGEMSNVHADSKVLGWGSYHLATPGKIYSMIRSHMPDLLERLLVCGTIFARMSPEQKTHLVEDLQKIGYCVGMCGDGANDCGALKAAHAGISLSEAEASVASPFTSKIPNIECVPKVIREGRTALVTSFGVFKYMALYSVVQFVSVLILYSMSSNLGDFQFLYIDLVLITSLALVMGRTAAYPTLVPQRPGGSLMSPVVIFSLISQISIQVLVQVAGIYYVRQQAWYTPVNSTSTIQITCHDNVVLFSLSSFQYILLAIVFSQGAPYRVPFYRNIYFLVVLILLTVLSSFLTVLPGETLQKFFQLAPMPDLYFRLTLLGIATCNLLFSYFVEQYIAHSRWLKMCLNRLRCKTQPKNFYKKVKNMLRTKRDWPPL